MKNIMLLVSVVLVVWAPVRAPRSAAAAGARAAGPPQESYIEPVTLFRYEINGHTILAVNSEEISALVKRGAKEQRSLGFVFARPMPSTKPLYRLAKMAGDFPSADEKFYTTSREEADKAAKSGYFWEGALCYVAGPWMGSKPLFRLTSPHSGRHTYTSDPSEMKRLREQGLKDGGPVATLFEHPFGWRAEGWIFAESSAGEPPPESYTLVCRRGDNAFFAKDGVAFKFAKAPKRLGRDLAAGECAWIDRAMAPAEPDVLFAPLTNNFDPSREHRDELYWTFKVYNDGRGRMIVVGAEAGRPAADEPDSIEVRRDVQAPVLPPPPRIERVRPIVIPPTPKP